MEFLAQRAAASAALALAMAAVPITSFSSSASSAPNAPALKFEVVAVGLHDPLYLSSPPGGASRLFIVEQPGRIRIHEGGAVLPTPFLDLTGIVKFGGEQGLLCMVFHPQSATNVQFSVSYSRDPDNVIVVERFVVSADPNVADPTSGTVILALP